MEEEEDEQDNFMPCDTVPEDEDEEWSRPVDDQLLDCSSGQLGQQRSPVSKAAQGSKLDHPRTIIQIDIDCFYAQVEMIHNPALRDVPLGIQQKYLVVTCNYPARARGVTKLMGINEAKKKCPELVLVSGEDLTRYREMSYKISEFLMKYTPNVERLGFDENFLDVTEMVDQRIRGNTAKPDVVGHLYSPPGDETNAKPCSCGCHFRMAVGSQIAADIRSALNIELGITCCAGVAHNKLLAKLVGGVHKPNQQTTIFPCHGLALVVGLDSAHCIPGIGWSTKNRLKALGVVSITDLQQFPLPQLEEEFGVAVAATIHQLSFGIDDSPVITYSRPQILSVEDSFRQCASEEDARSHISKLFTSLLPRVQEDGRTPHTLRLSVRKVGKENKWHRESRQCNLPLSIATKILRGRLDSAKDQLIPLAVSLFHKMVDTSQLCHLKLINVAFAKLEETADNNIASFFGAQGSVPSASQSLKTFDEVSSPGVSASLEKEENKAVGSETAETSKRKHPNSVASFFTKKQKVNGSMDSEKPERTNNKTNPELGSGSRKQGSESDSISLPPDVDPDVFVQLPPEIQLEILHRAKQQNLSRQLPTSAVKPSAGESYRDRLSGMQPSTDGGFFSSQKKPLFSLSKSMSTAEAQEKSLETTGETRQKTDVERFEKEAKTYVEQESNKSPSPIADSDSKSFPERTAQFTASSQSSDTKQKLTCPTTTTKSTDSQVKTLHTASGMSSRSTDRSSEKNLTTTKSTVALAFTSSQMSVPKGVAPDVFSALPPEIQREVAAEMAIQKQSIASGESTTRQQKSDLKSPTKKVNSMLNYLKKR